MTIPKLKKETRSREYDCYNNEQCFKIVKSYLFEGKSHRSIDKEILSLDA